LNSSRQWEVAIRFETDVLARQTSTPGGFTRVWSWRG